MKFALRQSDRTVFRASYPDGWNDGDSIASMMSGDEGWYFRRVRLERRWFRWAFEDTGDVWETKSPDGWDVITREAALSILRA